MREEHPVRVDFCRCVGPSGEAPAEENLELANEVGCSAEQLRSRNSKMTQVTQEEFTGYGWLFGWHYGRADAGEMNGATIYEMHPEVAASWRSLRRSIAAVS